MRRLTIGLSLLAIAGCRGPLYTQVLTVAPASAYGSALHAATAAAFDRAPSSPAAGNPTAGTRWRESGADRGSLLAAAGAFDADDRAAPASAGRLHLFADPQFAWAAQDPQSPDPPQQAQDDRWSDFLPLGREAVLAAGYELPRAFGFSVAYTRLRRDIEVDEVRTGVDGAAPQPVGFLAVEADSVVDNVMGRLDAWILPFWNVSVLGGWTWNESDSEVTVTIPLPVDPRDVTFRVPTHQDGPTWAFGTNLAGGYGEWFVSGDATWIYADMQNFALIEGFLGSLRSGWNGKVDGKSVRLWGGVTYWDTATTIEGDVVTSDGTVHFEVEQGPVTPYSLQVGGSYDFDRAYGVVLEYHMLKDVRMLVASAALRF